MEEKGRLNGKLELSVNQSTNPNVSPSVHIKMIIKHACIFSDQMDFIWHLQWISKVVIYVMEYQKSIKLN